ncbi:hypothetical protein D3C72_2143950 [compost metagenome]
MPKLVTGFLRSALQSMARAPGTCMSAPFMGAMLYHQVTRWRSSAWATPSGSKRYSSTAVAPV